MDEPPRLLHRPRLLERQDIPSERQRHLRDGRAKTADLVEQIQGGLRSELGLEVAVLLRSASELRRITSANPFLPGAGDSSKLHVTFLTARPAAARVAARRSVRRGRRRAPSRRTGRVPALSRGLRNDEVEQCIPRAAARGRSDHPELEDRQRSLRADRRLAGREAGQRTSPATDPTRRRGTLRSPAGISGAAVRWSAIRSWRSAPTGSRSCSVTQRASASHAGSSAGQAMSFF